MIQRLEAWFFAPAPALRLASTRAVIGAFAAATLLGLLPGLWQAGDLGSASFQPVLALRALTSPPPRALVLALWIVAETASVALAIGLRYRLAAPLAAASFVLLASYRSSWGMIFHTENLLALHLLVLAFAPGAADVLSVDARRRPAQVVADGAGYGWPLRLLCALAAAAYLVAGIAKVRFAGAGWLTGETLRHQILHDNLRKAELGDVFSPIGVALGRARWLFAPLAWVSLALELGAPLSLVHRSWGRVWALSVVGFHLGVVMLMAIAFPYPMTGAAFVAFFDSERAITWCRARLAARRARAARPVPSADR